MHLAYLLAVSVHGILYPPWNLGHKIAGYYASKDIASRHKFTDSSYESNYDNYGNFNSQAYCQNSRKEQCVAICRF